MLFPKKVPYIIPRLLLFKINLFLQNLLQI